MGAGPAYGQSSKEVFGIHTRSGSETDKDYCLEVLRVILGEFHEDSEHICVLFRTVADPHRRRLISWLLGF